MTLELHITRRAAREIQRIVQWWVTKRPGAPDAVRKDLQSTLTLLLDQSDIGSAVGQVSAPGVRRFHVERIRYGVYYRVRGDRLEVVSV